MRLVRAGLLDSASDTHIVVLTMQSDPEVAGEIAAQLYLSARTVASHRAHIQQKTLRGSRAELVAYAREHGLLG